MDSVGYSDLQNNGRSKKKKKKEPIPAYDTSEEDGRKKKAPTSCACATCARGCGEVGRRKEKGKGVFSPSPTRLQWLSPRLDVGSRISSDHQKRGGEEKKKKKGKEEGSRRSLPPPPQDVGEEKREGYVLPLHAPGIRAGPLEVDERRGGRDRKGKEKKKRERVPHFLVRPQNTREKKDPGTAACRTACRDPRGERERGKKRKRSPAVVLPAAEKERKEEKSVLGSRMYTCLRPGKRSRQEKEKKEKKKECSTSSFLEEFVPRLKEGKREDQPRYLSICRRFRERVRKRKKEGEKRGGRQPLHPALIATFSRGARKKRG